jgi:D-galacturonate reductase
MYMDARARLKAFGDFSLFQAFMSQPKKQLATFAGWAGVSSDISFYLNSHHVDYHCWCMQGVATPISVCASASTGVANAALGRDCADSVTLMVQWRNDVSGNLGVATYTATWSASPSDVHRCAAAGVEYACPCRTTIVYNKTSLWHSQQRFFYSGQGGDITVDQAHRSVEVLL